MSPRPARERLFLSLVPARRARGSSLTPRHARDGTSVTEECPCTSTIAFAFARRVSSFPRLVLVVGSVVSVVATSRFSSRRQKDVESSGERGSRVSYRRALRLRLFSRRARAFEATSRMAPTWTSCATRAPADADAARRDLEGCPPRSGACRRSRRVLGRPARARRGWSRARRGRRALPRRVADRARRRARGGEASRSDRCLATPPRRRGEVSRRGARTRPRRNAPGPPACAR